jgi:hypothetical protein
MSKLVSGILEKFQTLFSKVKCLIKQSVVKSDSTISDTICDVLDGKFNEVVGDVDALVIEQAQKGNTVEGTNKMAMVVTSLLQQVHIPAYIAVFAGNIVVKCASDYVQKRYEALKESGKIS